MGMRIISGYLSMLMLGFGVLFAPAQAQDYIPDAEPLPGEYAIPEAEPIPSAEPLP